MFALYLIATIFISTSCDAAGRKYTALQFGTTLNDYIRFRYDMSPFRSSFTLTAWIKRVYTSSSYPVVFQYWASRTHEILIAPNGKFNRVLDDRVLDHVQSIQDKFTTPPGTWFHYALSWSSSTQTIDVYLDGERVATGRTSSGRELHMGGELWINRGGHRAEKSHVFGGQLYQLNVYSGVLTAEHIKEISDGGLCDLDFRTRSPVLGWEDILSKSRTGSVREVTVINGTGCLEKELDMMREKLNTMTRELNKTQDELKQVKTRLNVTDSELNNVTSQLIRTQDDLQTATDRLNRTEDELKNTKVEMKAQSARCNRTEGLLATCSSALRDTKSQLDGARKLENITQWDVLYREPYYNNVLTEELLNETKSSWDLMRELVGVNITDTIIEHFRKHDVKNSKCGSQTDILDMLGELIGDRMMMTRGVLQHFVENHNDGPCDD